jgi:hypothetical protein
MALTTEVNTRTRPNASVRGARNRRDNQECTTIELYFTSDEMRKLHDLNLSDHARIAVVRLRMKLLGNHCPSEGLKGRLAMIVKHTSAIEDMPPVEWLKLLHKVKAALEPLGKEPWQFEFITEYPPDPSDLPTEIFNHAYPTDPPAKQKVHGLSVPDFLRKSSKHLKHVTTCMPQHVPMDMAAHASTFGPQVQNTFVRYNPYGFQGVPAGYAMHPHGANMHPHYFHPPPHQPQPPPQYGMLAIADGDRGHNSNPLASVINGPGRTQRPATAGSADGTRETDDAGVGEKGKGGEKFCEDDEFTEDEKIMRDSMTTAKAASAALKKPAAAMKRPASARVVASKPAAVVVDHAKGKRPFHPVGSAAAPPQRVDYRGARIYTSWTKKAYRAIINPTTSPSDNKFAWDGYGGMAEAWKACLDAVDNARD